jgi:hypothetical protein
MVALVKNLGAVEPEQPEKVSSGRVLMLASFAFFVVIALFVAGMIAAGVPVPVEVKNAQGVVTSVTSTWEQWAGFVREVGDTIKWFLGPYVVGVAGSAYKTKKENE